MYRASLSLALTLILGGAVGGTAQEASRGPVHQGFDPASVRRTADDAGFNDPRVKAIEEELRCNCGCNLDTHSCQYQMQCGVSSAWHLRVVQAVERGEDADAVKAAFVAEFGPTVLMTPPLEGFNWAGYLMPFLALLAGAGVLVGLLVRRGGRAAADTPPAPSLTPEDEARLSAALQALEAEEAWDED